MIDGYKILNLPVNIDELKNNPLLLFPLQVNEMDGDILDKPRTAKYKEQIFTIKNNNVKLNGSLHKYHNNGEHNYNDYYFSDLTNDIFDLCNKFSIPAEISDFNNLEFGVNIHIPVKPEELFRFVINYKGTQFHKFNNINNGIGIECEKNNFIIKMYDKGNQYNRPGNLLRYEIKVIRMQFFKDNGVNISTLATLTNINNLYPLKTILKGIFDEILFYDYSIKENKLNAKERLILSNGRNPKYWENLLPKSKEFEQGNKDINYKRQRKKHRRELDNFKKIICKYSTSTLQKDISDLIEKKCTQLLTVENITGDKLTDISVLEKTTEKGQFNNSNIVTICPQPLNLCLTCGNEFIRTKKNKRFCSKKCKNDYTNPILNPKNNLLRRLGKTNRYPVLFDVSLYTVLSERQRELLNRSNSIRNSN